MTTIPLVKKIVATYTKELRLRSRIDQRMYLYVQRRRCSAYQAPEDIVLYQRCRFLTELRRSTASRHPRQDNTCTYRRVRFTCTFGTEGTVTRLPVPVTHTPYQSAGLILRLQYLYPANQPKNPLPSRTDL